MLVLTAQQACPSPSRALKRAPGHRRAVRKRVPAPLAPEPGRCGATIRRLRWCHLEEWKGEPRSRRRSVAWATTIRAKRRYVAQRPRAWWGLSRRCRLKWSRFL